MRKNRFRARFPKPHTFIAVVHVESRDQARDNVAIAVENGADGVFLIGHGLGSRQLVNIHGIISEERTGQFVGVNLLDINDPRDVFFFGGLPNTLDGLWTDNAWTTTQADQRVAQSFLNVRRGRAWEGVYFGGVEFKGQTQLGDAAAAAKAAIAFVDVITTSGQNTGFAPPVAKIKAMKDAIGDFPLAIASGMTADNVTRFMPYADCFLVATGISRSFTELNPVLVRRFADVLKEAAV